MCKTDIVGGAMSGYCSIGSETRPIAPNNTRKIEITVDSTGRLIKPVNVILSIIIFLSLP